MRRAGKRLLFDGNSARWLADPELQMYPAPVRRTALWLLGAGLVLVSVLIARIG